jgi:hypothetical protein
MSSEIIRQTGKAKKTQLEFTILDGTEYPSCGVKSKHFHLKQSTEQ